MAFRKGPGEDFHAAKDDALAINPRLKCKRCVVPGMGSFHRVYDGEKKIGEGRLSRDAWADALFRMERVASAGEAGTATDSEAGVAEGEHATAAGGDAQGSS